LHASLDLAEVAHLAANEGRSFLGCDQLSVAVRQGGPARVVAVSGASSLGRGRLVQLMAALADRVLLWGETLTYNGVRDEADPPRGPVGPLVLPPRLGQGGRRRRPPRCRVRRPGPRPRAAAPGGEGSAAAAGTPHRVRPADRQDHRHEVAERRPGGPGAGAAP